MYVAGYNNEGALEKLVVKKLNFKKGKATYDTEASLWGYDEIKVMLWNKDIMPLCEAAIEN